MIVKWVKFNQKREIISVEKFRVTTVRLQPAGLIELSGGEIKDILYLRFLATDLTNMLIKDE